MKYALAVLIACLACFAATANGNNTHHTTHTTHINAPKVSEIKRQHPKTVSEKAAQFFRAKDYHKAHAYYSALSQMKLKQTSQNVYRLGKSALHAGRYNTAKANLKKLLRRTNRFPLVTFEYACAMKRTGDYVEAIRYFEEYIKANKYNPDNRYVGIAERHAEACARAMRDKALNNYTVRNISSAINSSTSTIAMTLPSKHGYRLVEFQNERGTCIKKVLPSLKVVPLASSVGNPIFNSGSPHIAPDGETIYFTRQEQIENGDQEYKIYMGRMDELGDVVDIRKLGPAINRDGYSSLYPTVGTTEHGQEVLYFASTIPGGRGGYDLWYAVRMTNGEYTRPYNLGVRINSTNDEITPFYHQDGGMLYYSSNRVDGFGGFDVYGMKGEKKIWRQDAPTHLSSPINSHGDDLYFRIDPSGKGYFASDRNPLAKNRFEMYEFDEPEYAIDPRRGKMYTESGW